MVALVRAANITGLCMVYIYIPMRLLSQENNVS